MSRCPVAGAVAVARRVAPRCPSSLARARRASARSGAAGRERLLRARPPAYLLAAVRVMPPERRDPRQPTTRDVAARGARIRFVEIGQGPPLVLVHDYLASRV